MAVFVSYPFRLIIDYSFLKWVLTKCPQKARVISGLLRINIYSKEHKKTNNLLLKEDLDLILAENLVKDKDLILGGVSSFKFPVEIEDIIKKNKFDDITKRVILGIILTDEIPYSVAILTTNENLKKYQENPLFSQIKGLAIKTETEAIYLIESMFEMFCSQRENSR